MEIIRVEQVAKRYRIRQPTPPTQAKPPSLAQGTLGRMGERLLHLVQSHPSAKLFQWQRAAYETFWALRDVSFEVSAGERLGIIGRNGAGKSTLLKLLSRLVMPTQGQIKLWGRVTSLLEVGTGFHPELTGRENIYLNSAMLGMGYGEVRRKLDEIVAFAEVEQFLETPVKYYSSGMYTRLAFAVAAHLEPEILVVDEVLAVGDAAFQKKSLGKMEEMARCGRTLLFVSHNMGAVRALCSRVLWLEQGQLKASGDPATVVTNYLSAFDQEGPMRLVSREQHLVTDWRVTIEQVTVMDRQGRLKTAFLIEEPIRVQFNYQVREATWGTAWCLITTADNVVLLSAVQKDTMQPYHFTQDGVGALVIDQITLLPGRYRVTLGIFDTYNNFLDWAEDVISFEILPHHVDGRPDDKRLGFVTTKLEWEFA